METKQTELVSRDNEFTSVINREMFDQLPGDVTDAKDIKRWYDFRARYHQAKNLADFPFPLQIDIELNSACNFRCGFCVQSHFNIEKKMMRFETFKRIVDEGAEYGLCSIKMNYINEPLIVYNIDKYIKYAKSKGVLNIYFASNGVFLSREMGQKLIEARLSKIMISLDAASPETFLLMRSSRKYNEIVANIKDFLKLRKSLGLTYPLVRVNFLKTQMNMHESEAFIQKWEGVADMLGFQDQVGLPGVDDEDLPDADTSYNLTMLQNDKIDFHCSFPSKLVVVDSFGNILPCCTFSGREMPLGNIRDMTVKEAWDSIKMRELKSLHKRGGYRENDICLHCVKSSGAIT